MTSSSSATSASIRSRRRAPPATRAPSGRIAAAVAAPIPLDAPVTTAVFPSRLGTGWIVGISTSGVSRRSAVPSSTGRGLPSAWSTWSVVWVRPKRSSSTRSSSRRFEWQSASGATSTWAESVGKPDVIVQTWRSCTSRTSSTSTSARPIASASMPRGVDSSRISTESRSSVQEPATISAAIASAISGSA